MSILIFWREWRSSGSEWMRSRTQKPGSKWLFNFAITVLSVSGGVAFAAESGWEPGSAINAGHSAHWFDNNNPGQGILTEVLPERGQLALAWFTFADGAPGQSMDSGHRWLTGLGPFQGDQADVVLFYSHGGVFVEPGQVITEEIGEASIQMHSCSEAVLEYSFSNGLSGVINLTRLTPAGLCLKLSGQASFPEFAYLRAEADAEFDDGMAVDCHLEFVMEVELTSDDGYERHYTGAMGGEAARSVVDASGAGISFFADAYTPLDIRVTANRVDFRSTLPQHPRLPREHDSRFWSRLTLFEGDVETDGSVTGSWLCAPMDTRGDDSLFANGRWWLEPIPEDPPPEIMGSE